MSKADRLQPPLPDEGAIPGELPSPKQARSAGRPSSTGGGARRRAKPKGWPVPARIGFSMALVTLILDQASKLYTFRLFDLPVKEPVALGPFVNLIVVWNHGISYGLFQQRTDLGRWILIVVSILASAGLSVWIRRTKGKVLAASLGLIVGGAVGNVIDRLAYGAVFDFIQIHVGPYSWYVFNIADAAIVAGVVGLLYDSFLLEKRRTR